MELEPEERAKRDIDKLKLIIKEFGQRNFGLKYPQVLEWAENYLSDAKHFYENGDHFSAFGAANYAFGIIDAVFIIEKIR